MKCSCGDKKCHNEILWDTGSNMLTLKWKHDGNKEENNKEVSMYYDANSLIALISEARKALNTMTEDKQ